MQDGVWFLRGWRESWEARGGCWCCRCHLRGRRRGWRGWVRGARARVGRRPEWVAGTRTAGSRRCCYCWRKRPGAVKERAAGLLLSAAQKHLIGWMQDNSHCGRQQKKAIQNHQLSPDDALALYYNWSSFLSGPCTLIEQRPQRSDDSRWVSGLWIKKLLKDIYEIGDH